MAKPPEMSADFARWYTESFMDDGAVRDFRWKGIVDVSSKPTFKTVEVLIRLAFPSSVPAMGSKNEELEDAYASVVPTIAGGDSTFNPAQSARELQVLSAAALSRMFSRSADAAIAVVTASFAGARQPDLPMDLVGLARQALVALSSRQHVRADPQTLQVSARKVEFSVSPEAMQSMDATQWSSELNRLRDGANTALSATSAEQNRVIGLLQRQIALDEEELQILWWLIGGFSRHLDVPFNDVDEKKRPLRLASELGEMTKISPGPASIGALLTRAGVGSNEISLEEAVNAVEIDWAKETSTSTNISPVTTPIHFALEKRAELGSDETWQPGWTGLTAISADFSLPAVRLAELFYREHLFLHVDE